ncbi:di-heme-cytochrome C peroxidase [Roseicyclus sp.]|uniref:di-heme-cytochrome C peroxidase n=1 Tax=Roseicyclus sp. TaxID=1914329 RepID=UPI001BCE56F3|nr:di-heme-cytochrome C peroxidase [Roseicyclus sp.]
MIIWRVSTVGFLVLMALSHSAASDSHYGNPITVDQGWSDADRAFFYFAPQGSPILPLDYFLALEQPASEALFSDRAFLKSLGMIYWDDADANPEGLPVGLTVDRGRLGTEPQLGMNCSACHVTEIRVGDAIVLVDGGVSHFDFWSFMTALDTALVVTAQDDERLRRFVDRLAERDHLVTEADQITARLQQIISDREDWRRRNDTDIIPGPGRVDALNVILNQVTAGMLERPENARVPDAPVSYPALWDAPYLEVVQYNGVVPNAGAGAIGRNVGQVLGVFGQVDLAEGTLPLGYNSSVNVTHLMALEERLETLTSPSWSDLVEAGALPALDPRLVEAGQVIYQRQCASCHAVIDRTDRGELASIEIQTFDLGTIGTDPAAALGFAAREVVTGPIAGRQVGVVTGPEFCEVTHGNAVLAHVVAGVMLNHFGDDRRAIIQAAESVAVSGIHQRLVGLGSSIRSALGLDVDDKPVSPDYGTMIDAMAAEGLPQDEIAERLAAMSGDSSALFNELVRDHFKYHGEDQTCMEVLQTAQYRSRPLNGIWATGPYLHNGSVSTLADLLLPASQRPTQFAVANSRFDPVNVGFVSEVSDGAFVLDTSIPGNANSGHEYGVTLSVQDRLALLEYLKSL